MNIYTDPQRPMATTEGIYEINNPDENSPVLITSNFSLTYFIVSGEVESSGFPPGFSSRIPKDSLCSQPGLLESLLRMPLRLLLRRAALKVR